MDKKYVADAKLRNTVQVQHKKHSRSYQIGKVIWRIFLILSVVSVIASTAFGYYAGGGLSNGTRAETVMMGFMLPFLIIVPLSAVVWGLVQRLGVDKRFGLRMRETVTLEENELINGWVPRFKRELETEQIIYHINYKDITKIDYNENHQRLEIYGSRTREEVPLAFLGKVRQPNRMKKEKDSKPYKIYAYFQNMYDLMEELSKRTGLTINKTYNGDKDEVEKWTWR